MIAAGVILTATSKVFDLVKEEELHGTASAPLEIPPGAVVVPGSRPVSNASAFAREHGLLQSCALIVKYRDGKTDAKTALEDALR